jgi:beta-phosphoglucomutase-like phosphatase (HAD superfamily)
MDFTKFKAAIFDLDGTLVESNHVWSRIDEHFLGRRGIEVPADYFKAVSTMNFQAAAEYTNERFKLNENIADIMQEWQDMAVYEYSHVIGLVSGAGDFVRYLKARGVKLALATASSKALYEPVLKNNGLYEYFDFFATTEQVKRGKGFPDVYLFAAEGLGEKPCDCVVFEDIIEGIRGAKLGGFTAAACLNSHYKADWDRLKAEADISFCDYGELM